MAEIKETIEVIHAGDASSASPSARKLLGHFAKTAPPSSLTASENEIMTSVVEGVGNKIITARLNISPEAVR